MSWAASVYVDESGNIYGAAQTDQRGSSSTNDRTVGRAPVEHAGKWFGSQMSYRPFRAAVTQAAARAYNRKTVLDRIVEALADDERLMAAGCVESIQASLDSSPDSGLPVVVRVSDVSFDDPR